MTKDASAAGKPWWKWPGLYAWIALNIVASALFYEHFDVVSTALVVNVIAGAVATLTKWLRKEAVESIKESFTRMLESWRFARVAFGASAAIVVSGFFVSSVHVTAVTPPNPPVELYRFEEPVGHPELARVVDTAMIGRLQEHGDFWMRPRRDRDVWLVTSDLRRTKALQPRGWRTQKVVYPDQFQQMVAVSLLPMEYLLAGVGRTKPLRIVVREARPNGLTLAMDTLIDRSSMPALVLSFISPPPPDSQTRVRWRSATLALAQTAADSASVDAMVTNWAQFRWLRPIRDLNVGDTLEVVISKGADQILTQRLNLGGAISHVIVRRS